MYTTREEMKNLKAGDTFWVDGVSHTASTSAALCGDAEFSEEYIVYDENGEGWLESDFEKDDRTNGAYLEMLQKHRELIKNHQKSFSTTDPFYAALDSAVILMDKEISRVRLIYALVDRGAIL